MAPRHQRGEQSIPIDVLKGAGRPATWDRRASDRYTLNWEEPASSSRQHICVEGKPHVPDEDMGEVRFANKIETTAGTRGNQPAIFMRMTSGPPGTEPVDGVPLEQSEFSVEPDAALPTAIGLLDALRQIRGAPSIALPQAAPPADLEQVLIVERVETRTTILPPRSPGGPNLRGVLMRVGSLAYGNTTADFATHHGEPDDVSEFVTDPQVAFDAAISLLTAVHTIMNTPDVPPRS